jgi:hypothetical protein
MNELEPLTAFSEISLYPWGYLKMCINNKSNKAIKIEGKN